ncbi:MAG TPA: hydantoinase/oxoprolinase family protein [Acidobacteriota bacterium]|nr:hydantoinase/oxoprolinase family protein [Acidobacteriota bacterium]
MRKIGIDTGGTFTDFILLDGRKVRTLKLLSTPANPAHAVLQGLAQLMIDEDCEIFHGSTVATNALLERKGALVALITTRGFEDVIEIGRQNRPKLYSLFPSRPKPLVPSSLRFGITERILYDGTVLVPLHEKELGGLREKLRGRKVESLAVCLLFSYANSKHEKKIGRALRSLQIPISLSHAILPEYREYERTSTTVVNAYLAPIMGRYLGDLAGQLRFSQGRGSTRLRVMQSNGGVVSVGVAMRQPVRTILSGPAGGAVGAWEISRAAGYRNILSFDMGGTSTDVSLCQGGIRVTSESVIAHCPIGVPVIDIHTVGAGGGSIARFDAGGALRVGPESAGADPGPICYGKGNQITVTDANLCLGKLDPDYPLGGSLCLQEEKIMPAFRRLAGQMGMRTPQAAAQGVIDVANANMEAALRVISVERGYDPRDFTLVTFGGAGGLHAVDLAESLSIPRVLIPENPGLLSALGMLLSDNVQDFSQTTILRSREAVVGELDKHYAALDKAGRASMIKEGFPPERIRLERWIDMRYRGQSYELSFPYSHRFQREFHRRHEQRYGYADPARESEIVTLRVRARGLAEKPRIAKDRPGPDNTKQALIKEKTVIFSGRSFRTRIYERSLLNAGNQINGPALVFEYSASTAIPPGYRCIVDVYRNLVIEPSAT